MLDEAGDVALDLVVRHAAEIQIRHDALHVYQLFVAGELFEDLLRGAPGHELDVILDGLVLANFVEVLAHVRIALVALDRVEMFSQHFVMLERGAIVQGEILASEFFGAVRALVHERKAGTEGLGRRFVGMEFLPERVIALHVGGHELPGLLNDHEHAQAELGHHGH